MSATPGQEEPGGPPSALDSLGETIDRVSGRISHELFRIGIYVALPALVVLVTTDVTLRYVFNAPLQWARDVNGLLLLTSIFCALPHAWDRAYHIRMEVFYNRVSAENRRRLDVVASLAGIVFFGLMAVQAARFVPFMIRTVETGEDLLLPIWPFMAVLSLCSFVMVARLFANPAASGDGPGHGAVPNESTGDPAAGAGPGEGGS